MAGIGFAGFLVFWFSRCMGTFSTFEEIEAWQESRKQVAAIRKICRREAVRRDFAFIDQISRSARSVSANIAEGNDSLTVPEFIQFLGHSKRSNAEVRSHLYDALDEQYITSEEFKKRSVHNKRIGSMLASLIRYLQSLEQNRKRIVPHPENKQTRKPENLPAHQQ